MDAFTIDHGIGNDVCGRTFRFDCCYLEVSDHRIIPNNFEGGILDDPKVITTCKSDESEGRVNASDPCLSFGIALTGDPPADPLAHIGEGRFDSGKLRLKICPVGFTLSDIQFNLAEVTCQLFQLCDNLFDISELLDRVLLGIRVSLFGFTFRF